MRSQNGRKNRADPTESTRIQQKMWCAVHSSADAHNKENTRTKNTRRRKKVYHDHRLRLCVLSLSRFLVREKDEKFQIRKILTTIIIIIHLKWMICVAWSKRNGHHTTRDEEFEKKAEQLRKWLICFEHRKVQIIQNSTERNWISFWYQLTFRAHCSQSRFECIAWLYKNQIGHEIVMTKSWRPNKRDNYLDNSRATKQHSKNLMKRKERRKK